MAKAMAVGVGVICGAVLGAAAVAPVRLALMSAGGAEGKAYAAEYTQTLALAADAPVEIVRELRLRWHYERAAAGTADSVRATVRIDSIRASLSTPHGRQIIDLRDVRGAAMPIVWSRAGGAPRVEGTAPAADYGEMMGAPMPLSHVVAHAFPSLPAKAVQAGDQWEASWTRVAMDAAAETRRPVSARYRLTKIDGDVARIEITWHGDVPAGGKPGDAGAVDGKGFVLLGARDGVVREADLEETTSGNAQFGPGPFAYRQTVRVRITLARPAT